MVTLTIENMGDVVRYHRRKRKLTQYKLAVLAGVGKTMVFDLEKGKQTVKMNSLFKVLKALDIRLMGESSHMDAFYREYENHKDAS
jgi:HTH-type transcriptional regulator / antitoxin HipB